MVAEGATQVQASPGRWPFREENSGPGQCVLPCSPSHLPCAFSAGSFPDPGPQQAGLLSLQCLKAGGTSVRRPVTPSSLTAQGRWR